MKVSVLTEDIFGVDYGEFGETLVAGKLSESVYSGLYTSMTRAIEEGSTNIQRVADIPKAVVRLREVLEESNLIGEAQTYNFKGHILGTLYPTRMLGEGAEGMETDVIYTEKNFPQFSREQALTNAMLGNSYLTQSTKILSELDNISETEYKTFVQTVFDNVGSTPISQKYLESIIKETLKGDRLDRLVENTEEMLQREDIIRMVGTRLGEGAGSERTAKELLTSVLITEIQELLVMDVSEARELVGESVAGEQSAPESAEDTEEDDTNELASKIDEIIKVKVGNVTKEYGRLTKEEATAFRNELIANEGDHLQTIKDRKAEFDQLILGRLVMEYSTKRDDKFNEDAEKYVEEIHDKLGRELPVNVHEIGNELKHFSGTNDYFYEKATARDKEIILTAHLIDNLLYRNTLIDSLQVLKGEKIEGIDELHATNTMAGVDKRIRAIIEKHKYAGEGTTAQSIFRELNNEIVKVQEIIEAGGEAGYTEDAIKVIKEFRESKSDKFGLREDDTYLQTLDYDVTEIMNHEFTPEKYRKILEERYVVFREKAYRDLYTEIYNKYNGETDRHGVTITMMSPGRIDFKALEREERENNMKSVLDMSEGHREGRYVAYGVIQVIEDTNLLEALGQGERAEEVDFNVLHRMNVRAIQQLGMVRQTGGTVESVQLNLGQLKETLDETALRVEEVTKLVDEEYAKLGTKEKALLGEGYVEEFKEKLARPDFANFNIQTDGIEGVRQGVLVEMRNDIQKSEDEAERKEFDERTRELTTLGRDSDTGRPLQLFSDDEYTKFKEIDNKKPTGKQYRNVTGHQKDGLILSYAHIIGKAETGETVYKLVSKDVATLSIYEEMTVSENGTSYKEMMNSEANKVFREGLKNSTPMREVLKGVEESVKNYIRGYESVSGEDIGEDDLANIESLIQTKYDGLVVKGKLPGKLNKREEELKVIKEITGEGFGVQKFLELTEEQQDGLVYIVGLVAEHELGRTPLDVTIPEDKEELKHVLHLEDEMSANILNGINNLRGNKLRVEQVEALVTALTDRVTSRLYEKLKLIQKKKLTELTGDYVVPIFTEDGKELYVTRNYAIMNQIVTGEIGEQKLLGESDGDTLEMTFYELRTLSKVTVDMTKHRTIKPGVNRQELISTGLVSEDRVKKLSERIIKELTKLHGGGSPEDVGQSEANEEIVESVQWILDNYIDVTGRDETEVRTQLENKYTELGKTAKSITGIEGVYNKVNGSINSKFENVYNYRNVTKFDKELATALGNVEGISKKREYQLTDDIVEFQKFFEYKEAIISESLKHDYLGGIERTLGKDRNKAVVFRDIVTTQGFFTSYVNDYFVLGGSRVELPPKVIEQEELGLAYLEKPEMKAEFIKGVLRETGKDVDGVKLAKILAQRVKTPMLAVLGFAVSSIGLKHHSLIGNAFASTPPTKEGYEQYLAVIGQTLTQEEKQQLKQVSDKLWNYFKPRRRAERTPTDRQREQRLLAMLTEWAELGNTYHLLNSANKIPLATYRFGLKEEDGQGLGVIKSEGAPTVVFGHRVIGLYNESAGTIVKVLEIGDGVGEVQLADITERIRQIKQQLTAGGKKSIPLMLVYDLIEDFYTIAYDLRKQPTVHRMTLLKPQQ